MLRDSFERMEAAASVYNDEAARYENAKGEYNRARSLARDKWVLDNAAADKKRAVEDWVRGTLAMKGVWAEP